MLGDDSGGREGGILAPRDRVRLRFPLEPPSLARPAPPRGASGGGGRGRRVPLGESERAGGGGGAHHVLVQCDMVVLAFDRRDAQ